MLLANILNPFPIKGNPFLSNGPKSLPRNPPDCPSLCNWVFNNFILAEELFANALQNFQTYVLVNNNLCRKLYSSLEPPATFDENFKVASVPFFIPDFNLLSCELENFTHKVYIESFYIDITLEQTKIVKHAVANSYDDFYNTYTVSCEKLKMGFFTSSIIKNNDLSLPPSKFSVKLICCIAFQSASSACFFLNSIAVIL